MPTITIYLPKSYILALDAINKKNRSELVRDVLWEDFLEEELLFRSKLSDHDHKPKITTVNLPDTLIEIIDKLVNGGSRSELIRTALRDFLKKKLLNGSNNEIEQKDVIFEEEDFVEIHEINDTDPTNKTACIGVRVTEATKKALEEKAKQKNLKFSEFVRQNLEDKIQAQAPGGN
jgi:metal-responsive CopG/Arc/MetJ family transcriptional regulator